MNRDSVMRFLLQIFFMNHPPPTPTIPATNLPAVSTTPAENLPLVSMKTFRIEDFFRLPFPFSAKFETALMV
jgi:hypothetical protein